MYPAKSLTELAYRTYKQHKNKASLAETPLIPLTFDELDIREPKHPWITRLLKSKLLLKGKKRGHYLIYPPHIFFKALYAEDEVEFNKKLTSLLFPKAVILTSADISPHTLKGYFSTEIDAILRNKRLYFRVHRCLSDVFFWHIPEFRKTPKIVLLALTQFVRADGRTLLNMYQLVQKMSPGERDIFIDLVHKTSVPIPIIKFILDILGEELKEVKPEILHPEFRGEWSALFEGEMSGTMFLEVINPRWDEIEV